MRPGFDRLARTAGERSDHDPARGGDVFVFANQRATQLKLLWVERNGVCVLYKRLHRTRFELPLATTGSVSVHIDGAQLAKLLAGVSQEEPSREKRPR
jgi:transposase